MKQNIGLIGLSVMGSNLALNIADHDFSVSVYNRTSSVTEKMMQEHPHKNIVAQFTLEDFVQSLERPRKVILMVKAGGAVDSLIEQLLPLLEKGDIIIDGGNSYFKDTQRRSLYLAEKDLHYFGVGISGGEEGARFGPAMMPGGNQEAYEQVRPIFEAISAKVNGNACCAYTSTDGAGHYVKMVHNGIEYGDMQLISEAYMLLKHVGGFSNEELAQTFKKYNQGDLESYLIDITAKIFEVKEGEDYLVDKIMDKSSQKGTGKWTNEQAIDLGMDISVISAALNGRFMSVLKEERSKAEALYGERSFAPLSAEEKALWAEQVGKSLYAAKIISYAQGFKLLQAAEKQYDWKFDYSEIAKIFRGGCIIQAKLLQPIIEAYSKNKDLENLLFDPYFYQVVNENQKDLRQVLVTAIQNRVAVPAFASALSYLDVYTTKESGANLVQAQRDYFGAHTFERKDKEGSFHFDWVGLHGK